MLLPRTAGAGVGEPPDSLRFLAAEPGTAIVCRLCTELIAWLGTAHIHQPISLCVLQVTGRGGQHCMASTSRHAACMSSISLHCAGSGGGPQAAGTCSAF
jgi:hypothetical protein